MVHDSSSCFEGTASVGWIHAVEDCTPTCTSPCAWLWYDGLASGLLLTLLTLAWQDETRNPHKRTEEDMNTSSGFVLSVFVLGCDDLQGVKGKNADPYVRLSAVPCA